MDFKNKNLVVVFLILMLFGTVMFSLYVGARKLEKFSTSKNILDSYANYSVLDKAPRSILKKEGESTIPKTVRFKEFDLIKSSENKPESPWFQADSVNKYDPKFVDVFKTSF